MSDLVETMPSDKRPNDEPKYTIGGVATPASGNLQDVYARLDALEQAVFHAGHTTPAPTEPSTTEASPLVETGPVSPTPEQIAALPTWAQELVAKGEHLTGLA